MPPVPSRRFYFYFYFHSQVPFPVLALPRQSPAWTIRPPSSVAGTGRSQTKSRNLTPLANRLGCRPLLRLTSHVSNSSCAAPLCCPPFRSFSCLGGKQSLRPRACRLHLIDNYSAICACPPRNPFHWRHLSRGVQVEYVAEDATVTNTKAPAVCTKPLSPTPSIPHLS